MANTVPDIFIRQVLPSRERSLSICHLNLPSFNAICDIVLLIFEDFFSECYFFWLCGRGELYRQAHEARLSPLSSVPLIVYPKRIRADEEKQLVCCDSHLLLLRPHCRLWWRCDEQCDSHRGGRLTAEEKTLGVTDPLEASPPLPPWDSSPCNRKLQESLEIWPNMIKRGREQEEGWEYGETYSAYLDEMC